MTYYVIPKHQEFRNLAKDVLVDIKLFQNNVFFGINGSGKSSICTLLSHLVDSGITKGDGSRIQSVYSFNKEWRQNNVSHFEEGGSAPGVTTVSLAKDARATLKKITLLKEEREQLTQDQNVYQTKIKKVEDELSRCFAEIRKGLQKTLLQQIPELSTHRFNKNAYLKIFESIDASTAPMSRDALEAKISLASGSTPEVGALPNPPSPPLIDETLKKAVSTRPSTTQSKLDVDRWVREGFDTHSPSTPCRFCGNEYTDARHKALQNAFDQIDRSYGDIIKNSLVTWRTYRSQLEYFAQQLSELTTNHPEQQAPLQEQVSDFLRQVEKAGIDAQTLITAFSKKLDDPSSEIQISDTPTDLAQSEQWSKLMGLHESIVREIQGFSSVRLSALEEIKKQCCIINGHEYFSISSQMRTIENELKAVKDRLTAIHSEIDELQQAVAGTEETAKFISDSLQSILGSKTLTVSLSSDGRSYKIARSSDEAKNMSEGERKLVSLLYFLSTLRSVDNSDQVKRSIVAFDDIGAEFDDARLFTIDRFINSTLTENHKPAIIIFFTHSLAHFRLLQSRLKSKVNAQKPSAAFYHVFKSRAVADLDSPSTKVEDWGEQHLLLSSDYMLSFKFIAQQMLNVMKGAEPDIDTGNRCRRVLETFTEFKDPSSDEFGNRLDSLIKHYKLDLSPALSKMANDSSHSSWDRGSALWNRELLEQCLIRTLELVRAADHHHFKRALTRLVGKEESHRIESYLKNHLSSEVFID